MRARAAATVVVMALGGLTATVRAPDAAPENSANIIPANVTAPLPAGRVDDARLVRAAQRRATRAERRHALHVEAVRRARAAAARQRARQLAEHRRLARLTASSYGWAHTPKAIGVANCESGPGPAEPRYDRYVGDPHLADPNGHYGKWQFSPGTADSVGAPGAGIAQLPEAEQDYYAWLLWKRDGWSPWECASLV